MIFLFPLSGGEEENGIISLFLYSSYPRRRQRAGTCFSGEVFSLAQEVCILPANGKILTHSLSCGTAKHCYSAVVVVFKLKIREAAKLHRRRTVKLLSRRPFNPFHKAGTAPVPVNSRVLTDFAAVNGSKIILGVALFCKLRF